MNGDSGELAAQNGDPHSNGVYIQEPVGNMDFGGDSDDRSQNANTAVTEESS